MPSITIEEAQNRLPELVARLAPGEEILLTQNEQLVAKLVGQAGEQPRPVYGRGKGKLIAMVEDDEHLKGFEDDRE